MRNSCIFNIQCLVSLILWFVVNSFPDCQNQALQDSQIYALIDFVETCKGDYVSWYKLQHIHSLCNDTQNTVPKGITNNSQGMITGLDSGYWPPGFSCYASEKLQKLTELTTVSIGHSLYGIKALFILFFFVFFLIFWCFICVILHGWLQL